MSDFFQRETAVRFIDGNEIPDFHGAIPGAREGGRSVCAAPFELGPRFAQLRPPLDLISPWGMGIASGAELRHFLNAMRSWRSFGYVTRRASHAGDDREETACGRAMPAGDVAALRLGIPPGTDFRV